MVFLIGALGMFAGHLLIGGTLSFLLSRKEPEQAVDSIYGWIGKIAGVIIAIAIYKSV